MARAKEKKAKAGSAGENAQGNIYGAAGAQGHVAAPRHRCAICGVTDVDDPNEEFRFCTTCEGAFEYCSKHLHNHRHVYRNAEGKLVR